MATVVTTFQSAELNRKVTFSAIIPTTTKSIYDYESKTKDKDNTQGLKTLYLLHGWNGNHEDWLQNTNIVKLADQYNLAIIMPSGDNSFYVDQNEGANYSAFIGEELVSVTRQLFPLSTQRDDTFIGGLSMGGYGALINGFKYDSTFSKVIALSSSMLHKNDKAHDLSRESAINTKLKALIQGNTFAEMTDAMDTYHVIKNAKTKPEIFLAIGTEDYLYKENKAVHDWLEKEKIVHEYLEAPGNHNWLFWEKTIHHALDWLFA